ncbi:MAG: ATPase [Anaerolineaceae bacterium]|nr:ATPase [Anaerolineaceae bacterium]
MANFTGAITKIASVDLFGRDDHTSEWKTGTFVGRPFYLDYDRAFLLIADAWKQEANGIPQGSFLLAYYENEQAVSETLLLRVLRPTRLPTDNDITSSMIEYFKDDLRTTGQDSQLDTFTRYEFSFSGLECRILGTFYKNSKDVTTFGADVENFYSAHHYSVIKPSNDVLEAIVNFRESEVTGKPTDIQIARVRYSSSRRFQQVNEDVPVYVSPNDFLGKRTALFGMTRTGKSNTVKKIIQATVRVSQQSQYELPRTTDRNLEENLEPFAEDNIPKYPAGQIIFDINGEYANPNIQDEGTAIFELYQGITTRFSTIEKDGFKVMKENFYTNILHGFELVKSFLAEDTADYVKSFLSVDLTEPSPDDYSAMTRYERKCVAYLCCLHRAGFVAPENFKVRFTAAKQLNSMVWPNQTIDPKQGISLDQATQWFETIWENYTDTYFTTYQQQRGHEWADEDLKAILVFLTRKTRPTARATITGYRKLNSIAELHTRTVDRPFDDEIIESLRRGKIVIVDLSQGNPEIQRLYSEKICQRIFDNSMKRFINNDPNNFVQFYFEEAHNLFPKKENSDLSQIYNRIAKEGAKLNLGLLYATQEVSSISSNILKNTQNWFIAHLNNEDETREIKKYYDFADFTDGLVRFSANSDKGFVRMKTYSNPYVVPVQIDRFPENRD